jgi:hypothetical protein
MRGSRNQRVIYFDKELNIWYNKYINKKGEYLMENVASFD